MPATGKYFKVRNIDIGTSSRGADHRSPPSTEVIVQVAQDCGAAPTFLGKLSRKTRPSREASAAIAARAQGVRVRSTSARRAKGRALPSRTAPLPSAPLSLDGLGNRLPKGREPLPHWAEATLGI